MALQWHLNIEAEPLIAQHYPELIPAFRRLPTPIQRADFQRLVVLHHYGGYFFDLDAACPVPIAEWLERFRGETVRVQHDAIRDVDDIGLVTGMEGPIQQWRLFDLARQFTFATWAIGARCGACTRSWHSHTPGRGTPPCGVR